MTDKMPEGIPGTWKNRRRVIFSSLIFCAIVIFYIMIWGEDNVLHRSMAESSFLLSGAVIMSYVFGGVIDDKWKKYARNDSDSDN